MSFLGDAVGIFMAGDKPKVPAWRGVDAQQQQGIAIRGNTAALQDIEAQARRVNQFNWDQIDEGMRGQVSNYDEILRKGSMAVEDFIDGKIPDEVRRMIAQTTAEGAVASGTPGSGFANFKEARTLGLTSLDLIQRGLESGARWLGAAQARRPMFDVTSMFLTPQQQIAHATSERDKRWNYDWFRNQVKVMPSPQEQAIFTAVDNFGSLVESAAGMFMGGAMGGGGMMGGLTSMLGGGGGGMMGGGSGSGGGAQLYSWNPNAAGYPEM